jgi:F0F1-type ATP synthase membrane subunit b/b'
MSDEAFRWVIAVAVGLGCVAFLVQAGFVIALYRIAKKTQDKVVPLAERADPILDSAQKILVENRPRISEMSTEALEMIKTTRQEVTRISNLLEETTVRARARIAEIDEKVIDTVEQVEQVGGAVKGAVLKPVREANAIMAGVKAAVVTYAEGGRRPSVDHATQDEEMFI